MSILKYPHLFQPLKVRGTVFKNRLFAAPQGFYYVGPDNYPNAEAAAYFEIKARGGFASICVGDCIVDSQTGTAYAGLFPIDNPRMMPGFAALAGAVSKHGCIASAELSHGGMYAHSVYAAGRPLYGPVAIKDGKYGEVTEMPEEVILHIIDAFGKAAAYAKLAGFGMVTVHAGHGWLLPQFWSKQLNTRKDKWGGSFENRMRLPLAVLESIRRAVGPSFPIEIRMSATELNDKGYDLDEGIGFAKALDGFADIIHVSAGHHEVRDSFVITHPNMFLEDGPNAKYAAEIKKHVKALVATVGSFSNPGHMEEVLASGGADIIEMARQSLADPFLPAKARTGREDEIQECLRCMQCYYTGNTKRIHYCSINPVTSREREVLMAPAPRSKKTVLVVGGGIAGMQAALTSAERGHKVILCEKGTELGGVLLCEKDVPFKRHLAAYLKRQALLISRTAIDVRLNTEVTPEYARSLGPDVIVAALGARPLKPAIPGIDGPNVVVAEHAYANPEVVGKKTVILGGGLVGLELSVYLSQLGREVTVVELEDELTIQRSLHTHALQLEMSKCGVEVHLSTKVTEITATGLVAAGTDGELNLAADTVIYATGQAPLVDEAIALHSCAAEFYQIGDCVAPKNIMNATQTGFATAYDIGVV